MHSVLRHGEFGICIQWAVRYIDINLYYEMIGDSRYFRKAECKDMNAFMTCLFLGRLWDWETCKWWKFNSVQEVQTTLSRQCSLKAVGLNALHPIKFDWGSWKGYTLRWKPLMTTTERRKTRDKKSPWLSN